MIKKLFLLTIIFLGIFQIGNVFADAVSNNKACLSNAKNNPERLKCSEKYVEEARKEREAERKSEEEKEREAEIAEKNAQRTKDCDPKQGGSGDCIDKKSFMFDTVSNFGIGPSFRGSNTSEGANVLLGTIIQKLMVALGVLSVLIMTVGGGYIILYHGQDELLSKGKSIFMSGIIALVIALSSYMIVGLLRFILYNN